MEEFHARNGLEFYHQFPHKVRSEWFPKAQKTSESCRSVAVATPQQLHRPGALLERCSGQEAPVALSGGAVSGQEARVVSSSSAGGASGQGALAASSRSIVGTLQWPGSRSCSFQACSRSVAVARKHLLLFPVVLQVRPLGAAVWPWEQLCGLWGVAAERICVAAGTSCVALGSSCVTLGSIYVAVGSSCVALEQLGRKCTNVPDSFENF